MAKQKTLTFNQVEITRTLRTDGKFSNFILIRDWDDNVKIALAYIYDHPAIAVGNVHIRHLVLEEGESFPAELNITTPP